MTSALRLSTAGKGVSEGSSVGVSEGTGVSVKVAVGVTEAVSVGGGDVGDSVGGCSVFVGGSETIGIEGDTKLQASKINIDRVERTMLRFIGRICAPFQNNMP